MNQEMKALIDAPLANACKVNLPAGKRSIPRGQKDQGDGDLGCPKVSAKELRERKRKAGDAKLNALFDYYAATSLTAQKVAEHMGLYRQEQIGTDEQSGKPIFTRVLDVKRVDDQLSWRRKQAA